MSSVPKKADKLNISLSCFPPKGILPPYTILCFKAYIKCLYIYTIGKKYGIFFITAIFCIFVESEGCFCTWNTFLRADISFGGVNSTLQQNEVQRFKNNYFGIFLN